MLQSTQYLSFLLDDEEYALGILRVREIIAYGVVTTVPSMPQFIRGVINLRGSVVPVVDLAVKLGLGERSVTKTTCIIIVEVMLDAEPAVMGLIVDSVSQVSDFVEADIEPPPAFGPRIKVDFIQGMAKADRKFVMLLDIDRVLSTDELLAVSEAREEAAAVSVAGEAVVQE